MRHEHTRSCRNMTKKVLCCIGAATLVLAALSGCGQQVPEGSGSASASAFAEAAPVTERVTLTKDQVQILTDARLLSGVQDYIVEAGTDMDLAKLISYDKDVFIGVEVDDKAVDYQKAGEYQAAYELTIDTAALEKAMKGKAETVSFPDAEDAETILAGYETKVTVMTREDAGKAAKESADSKTAVITASTYEETVKDHQQSVSNQAQALSAPIASSASDAGNAGNRNNGNAGSGTPSGGSAKQGSAQQETAKPAQTEPSKPAAVSPVQTEPTQPTQPAQPVQPVQPQTEAPTEPPTQPVHVHNWVAVYRTETVDQGFYQEKWEPHQVCRGCGMIMDGMDDREYIRHLANCGPGSSYEAYVSVGQVWTPVMVEQQVLDHYECSECGARQ